MLVHELTLHTFALPLPALPNEKAKVAAVEARPESI